MSYLLKGLLAVVNHASDKVIIDLYTVFRELCAQLEPNCRFIYECAWMSQCAPLTHWQAIIYQRG